MATDFDTAMARKIQQFSTLNAGILPAVAELTLESIRDGSPVTGAPGQPEVSGDLAESWHVEYPSPTVALIISQSPYARQNEDGVQKGGKPYVQRSSVGGRHSIRLTRAAFPLLVREAARRVQGGGA